MSLIQNKKAHFNYEILEKFEAGIELFGYEVKSIRGSQGSLEGAHVIIRGGEGYLVGSHIPIYQSANAPQDADPDRTRKLLLHKKELLELQKASETKGLTLIPISMYNKLGKIKVEIAIVKGKKLYDKRETIKKRDTDREMRREVKVR